MSLHKAIIQWDGRSIDSVIEIYHRFNQDRGFTARLLKLAADDATQIGATWLLKHHLENNPRTAVDEKAYFKLLFSATTWETKLHLLQCLAYVSISNAHKKPLDVCLRHAIADDNINVRAWAFNGFNELALSHQEYRKEVDAIFTDLLEQESASVKARVKSIITELAILVRD